MRISGFQRPAGLQQGMEGERWYAGLMTQSARPSTESNKSDKMVPYALDILKGTRRLHYPLCCHKDSGRLSLSPESPGHQRALP